jgi:hypothetical protein
VIRVLFAPDQHSGQTAKELLHFSLFFAHGH